MATTTAASTESPIPDVTVTASNSSNPNTIHAPDTRRKRTTIFFQDECLKHRYIRSRDTSHIVERPERLRAVKLGLAAAISRIESTEPFINATKREAVPVAMDESDLADALARMAIARTPTSTLRTTSVVIRRTSASVSLLNHAAVKFIHGDIDRDIYLENLIAWARDSQKNIMLKRTELPEGFLPSDLYLCPGSIDAIQGAVGAVCEAVDASVMATRRPLPEGQSDTCERAFVVIRPPGHHCGEDTPCGFCFVNNVAVGAAHAHLRHDIRRIVILDIDLHHGNGTQSIVWQINEETYRETMEFEANTHSVKMGPQIFYGSLHDILSFPCEDGKPAMVQAASTSIHGPHGQYIENIHLQKYDSEDHFWDVLYPRYLNLIDRARDFLDKTGGPGDDVMVFVSCGFDAGEHEYSSMSRHDRKVPVGFYHQFTRETCRLADTYALGRVVSVLEGGYSDRALISGAMAHLCGLVDIPSRVATSESDDWVDPAWWGKANLGKLEKASKPRKSASARASTEEWLTRTLGLFSALDGNGADTGTSAPSSRGASTDVDTGAWTPPTSMTLRERKTRGSSAADSTRTSKDISCSISTSGQPSVERTTGMGTCSSPRSSSTAALSKSGSGSNEVGTRQETPSDATEGKKLPRVILHVRPPDTGS